MAALAGCGRFHAPPPPAVHFDEPTFASKPATVFVIPLGADGAPVATVVGAPKLWKVGGEETLLDVARYFGLGYEEIVQANPDLDPWVPTPGAMAKLPTQWTLPCCRYDGLVVNVAEMRLYYYRRLPERPGELWVFTAPVAVGEPEHQTPRGLYAVRAKTENPTWVIPESIRREHIRERGDHRHVVAGGDDENPLGRYRLSLTTKAPYAIHGTNIAWGPGMAVSHGCIRLYPEDIERLYPLVPVGTRVDLTYQAVKIGRRGGAVYVEAAPDVYGKVRDLGAEAVRAMARRRDLRGVSRDAVRSAAARSQGLPVAIGGAPTPAGAAGAAGDGRRARAGE